MTIYNAPLSFIDKIETKRYAGLGMAEFDKTIIDKACFDAQIQSNPKGIWKIYDYNSNSGKINSSPISHIKGVDIKKYLKNAEKVVILAITIGDTIEKTITTYFKQGEYAYSVLLDAAATTAVETTANIIEKLIEQELSKLGYTPLPRFSPGYGDWDITFQSYILELCQAEKIDISLTENYMLIPRKSITAIIGAVPNQTMHSASTERTCQNCKKLNCIVRREN